LTKQKTQHRKLKRSATWNPPKNESEPRCSWRVQVYMHIIIIVNSFLTGAQYLCIFAYSGVQYILCCVLFFFVPYVANFSRLSIFDCPFSNLLLLYTTLIKNIYYWLNVCVLLLFIVWNQTNLVMGIGHIIKIDRWSIISCYIVYHMSLHSHNFVVFLYVLGSRLTYIFVCVCVLLINDGSSVVVFYCWYFQPLNVMSEKRKY
jgi:hypothetical protein